MEFDYTLLLPVLAGAVGFAVVQGLKAYSKLVDRLPGTAKAIAATLFAAGAHVLAIKFGITFCPADVPCTPETIDVKLLGDGLVAMLLHAGKLDIKRLFL